MSAPNAHRRADHDALDALVDAEVALILRRRPRPAFNRDVDEALFLDQASAFLRAHPDPDRLIAEMQRRTGRVPVADIAAAPPPPPPPPEPPAEAPRRNDEEDPT